MRIRPHYITGSTAVAFFALSACSSATTAPGFGSNTGGSGASASGSNASGASSGAGNGGAGTSGGSSSGGAASGAAASGAGGSSAGDSSGGGGASGASSAGAGWDSPTPATATTKFPFPQNRKTAHCNYPTVAVSTINLQTQAAYSAWKSTFVTTVGAPSGTARVQDPATSDVTVSEGIGYGMLIAVYMADKTLFDELWGYAKANFDGHSLMNWKIDATGAVDGAGSATDADEDIAWSLLMADAQWGGYTSAAQGYIGAIASSGEIHDNIPNIGDNSPTATTIHPDYVAPAYYPKFGSSFSGAVAAGYALLDSVRDGTTGLVPDDSSPTGPNGTTSFGYEASRVPLRVGLDFCLNGSSSAQSILTAEVAYFSGVGAANLKLPIPIAGGAGQDPSGAISGPAGVAAMVSASNQAFLDASWLDTYKITLPANNSNNYFGSSLGVISMLVMGGNFLDYTSL